MVYNILKTEFAGIDERVSSKIQTWEYKFFLINYKDNANKLYIYSHI